MEPSIYDGSLQYHSTNMSNSSGSCGCEEGCTTEIEPQNIFLATTFIITSFFGIILNCLTIPALISVSLKYNSIKNLMLNRSIADLLICVVLPLNVVGLLSPSECWPLPDWTCTGVTYILYISGGCSIFSDAIISV